MTAGAFVMRGAGCTINDMWDQKIDQQVFFIVWLCLFTLNILFVSKVERTKNRPLASKQILPLNAWIFLGAQLSVGLFILLQLNWYSILMGASSLGNINVNLLFP